jgi:signal transduction histidine kinase
MAEQKILKQDFKKDDLAETLESSVSKNKNPAIICKSKEGNPNYLSIIFANQKFYDIFNINEFRLIGKNYDFLFDDLDLDYSSEDQVEFIRLIKAVKDFHQCSIIVSVSNHNITNLDKVKFKISFEPQGAKDDEGSNYAIFTFEKFKLHKVAVKDPAVTRSNIILLRNLERALRNERLLREVGNLIISDLSIEEISSEIAKSLCQHLKTDRCIIHDYKDGETSFVVEHHDSDSRAMLKDNRDKESLETLTKYINFQDNFYKKFGNKTKRSSVAIAEDIAEDRNFVPISDICRKFSISSQVVVSTSLNGKLSGGIYIHQSTRRSWLAEEIELIETIADQFALALDRSASIDRIMVTNHALMEKTSQLKESLRHEKEMRKTQNDFVAIISHEFKTPLQIIDSTREVLSRKLRKLNASDESIEKSLERIKSGIKRMGSLISSTLSLAKIESGEGEIRVERSIFSLKDFIQDIIEKSLPLAANKNIKILTKIDELPDNFNGDSRLLDHAFTNIVSNAIKYSRSNKNIKVIAKADKERVAIRVVDQGIGIPSDEVGSVGKKFFRAKNTLSVAGTGIGLYLTKHFVELHNGELLIESKLNIGTSVTVILPNNIS